VLVGGAAGGALRHLLATSPATTLAVNLVGAGLLGVIVVLVPPAWRPLAGTGFCGGLTTFGTVVVVADQSLGHGRVATGLGFAALNLLGGVVAAGLGVLAAHRLTGRQDLAPEDPDVEVA
jgi:CrcB protein